MTSRLLTVAGLLLLSLFILVPSASAIDVQQPEENQANPIQVPNPASDLWRQVRQRDDLVTNGSTQVRGVDTAILINVMGEEWRQFRMQQLVPYGGYYLIAMLAVIAIFYLVRGKITVSKGPSDKKLYRYSLYERTIHWFMATVFIFLGLTGLVILFGRATLVPLFGNEGFSYLATASKVGHDLAGLLFALALLLMFFKFVGRNFFNWVDMKWIAKAGGFFSKHSHPEAGFFNAGEKSVFWLVVLGGTAIIVSGVILLFANFGQGREFMSLSHVVHGIAAVILVGVIFGHIYIATIGTEGALEGMTTGYCDLNWAKEHHNQWADKAESQAVPSAEVEKMRGM